VRIEVPHCELQRSNPGRLARKLDCFAADAPRNDDVASDDTWEETMLKIVTLMKRRSGLSVEDFQKHLRDTHGPLAANGPGLRRFVQSCALPQGYGKGELLFDAVEEMWFDSREAYESYHGSAEFAAAQADADTFLDSARTIVMPVDIHVIKDGRIPDNAVKNIEFVNKRPGMGLEQFRAYWRNVHGPLAATIPVMHRYEQNHLALGEYAKGEPPAYDGLAITWFASTADMKRGTTTPQYAATRADELNFLPDGHLPIIVTREHVLV
jgi:uncharacterized protein (TIGR02118 family)